MKKININKYPKKWKELSEKYDYEECVQLYYNYCRAFLLEKYIYKYGKEVGEKLYYEKKSKIKHGVRLDDLIEKHGEIEGRNKYENWKKAVAGNKENFIIRHGEDGVKKFEEFKKKCIVKDEIKNDLNSKYNSRKFNSNLQFYLDKGFNLEDAQKQFTERQKTTKLDNLIKKHGDVIGKEKYLKYNKKRVNNLENFIERHGELEGVIKYEKYLSHLKLVRSKKYLIDKHGVDWYNEYINRKINYLGKLRYSQVSFLFFEKIMFEFYNQFKKVYYGDNEYTFYFKNNEFSLIKPDFYIKDINYCIEFYGDFWHKNPKIEKYDVRAYDNIREKDNRRIEIIRSNFNAEVDIIWENDYRNNPQEIIKQIVNKIKNKIL